MIIIFLFSSQPNSGNQTHNIITGIFPNIKEPTTIETINIIIRKLAHITEYFILTLLIHSLLKEYNKSEKTILIQSLIICFIYSITDEIHQLFVPGRTGIIIDCIIDTLGGLIYIVLYKLKKLSAR